jgi:hypothetical protein
MSSTETIETAHGPIEYDTVPCANCEHDVVADEAVSVVLGGEIDMAFSSIGKVHLSGADIEAAHLCPYCAESVFDFDGDSGLIDTVRIARYRRWNLMGNEGIWLVMAAVFGVLALVQLLGLIGVL